MKESLVARQAALLKQNAELNERVVAIEQRRQQQLTGASSSAEPDDDDDANSAGAESDPPGSARLAGGKAVLTMDLSASIDSFGSRVADATDAATVLNAPSERIETETSTRRKPRPSGASSALTASPSTTPTLQDAARADPSGASPDGLGLEATVRYQKARLRVLQDEVDTANSHVKELVRLFVSGPLLLSFRSLWCRPLLPSSSPSKRRNQS